VGPPRIQETVVLGIQPIIGRGFREDEGRAGAAPVVLLSEALWQQRYARDPAVAGRSIFATEYRPDDLRRFKR
jgi:hypothetical protein